MGAQSDKAKGRIEEAAGIVTGDEKLESQGKADRQAGAAQHKVDVTTHKIEKLLDSSKDKVGSAIHSVTHALHRS